MTTKISRPHQLLRLVGGRSRQTLRTDLARYTTSSDLHELAAILDRHSESDAAEIRDLVNWTKAA